MSINKPMESNANMSDQNLNNYVNELTESAADREAAISEGIRNLKSKISGLKIDTSKEMTPAQKSVSAPKGGHAAGIVDKYRAKIRMEPESGIETPEAKERPVTKASRENTKAMLRALAGERSSGDVGNEVITKGGYNQGKPEPMSAILQMNMEDYTAHIFGSFGLTEASVEVQEEASVEVSEEVELTMVGELEQRLLGLSEATWQEVDRVTRELCVEQNITLKELNKEFREEHGIYPDKWAKAQTFTESCGWFPLEEATRIHKIGQTYDVSFPNIKRK